MERELLRKREEKANELANSEILRANLLLQDKLGEEKRKKVCSHIYDDSLWLMDEMTTMIPLEDGRLHIAEAAILHNSRLIGKKLWELNLPKEIIIGCILRGNHSLIPRGDTSVKEGDILFMLTSDKQKLNAVKGLTKS